MVAVVVVITDGFCLYIYSYEIFLCFFSVCVCACAHVIVHVCMLCVPIYIGHVCMQIAHVHAWVWFISSHMKDFKLVA